MKSRIERAAEEYINAFTTPCSTDCKDSFIAGAKVGASDQQKLDFEFVEWIPKRGFVRIFAHASQNEVKWCDESKYEWMGESDRLITTSELFHIFEEEKGI